MPRRSRLSKNYTKKSQRNFILSILGIVIVLFLLLRYGIPLLSDASFLFSRVTSKPSADKVNGSNNSYVPPPSIDPLPQVTKNQDITVTGTSLSGLTVYLYLNGVKQADTVVKDDGNFSFENVGLTEGDNIVKAKAVKDKNDSEYSDSQTINYKKSNPNLTIDNPHDDDHMNGGSMTNVTGKADPDDTVTVNDFQAIIDGNGNYSYNLTLKGGDNQIQVIATDPAGNQTQKTIHVSYSQ